jgi:ATP-dependent Clp protease adaptor protein ClpS
MPKFAVLKKSTIPPVMMKFFNVWNTQVETEEDIALLTEELDAKKLILHNDDYNTFDWVIETLVEVCKHSTEQAEQCAYIVHFKGKCQVKHGAQDHMERMHAALVQRGLTATVE